MKKIIIACLVSLAACETPANLDMPGRSPTLVLCAVLEADADSAEVVLSLTRPGDASGPWPLVEGARVELREEGNSVALATERAPGKYHFKYPVKSSTTYRITASHPDHGAAWGETTVPAPLLATIDTAGRLVINRWQDTPGERNYYWLGTLSPYDRLNYGGPRRDSLRLRHAIYTTSLLADPFNRIVDESAEIITSYEHLARVEDSGMDGQEIEIDYLGEGWNSVPFITSADANYDAYIKSSLLNNKRHGDMEALPLFHEPAYTHSNIRGGVGLVASHVTVRKNLLRVFPSPLALLPRWISIGAATCRLEYDEHRRLVEINRNGAATRISYRSDTEFTAVACDENNAITNTEHYKQEGNKVFLNGAAVIELTDDGRLAGCPGERFETDERGNVTRRVATDEQGREILYEYAHDDCNGIFKHARTPPWYIYTRLFPGHLANNRIEERANGRRLATSITYNRDDYPKYLHSTTGEQVFVHYIDAAGKEYNEYAPREGL